MLLVFALTAATLFLAFSNGANDNFKGVATLYGSNAASYRSALLLATAATFAGCVASVFLAETLLKAFSGKGLVPDVVAASPMFLVAVALGAATTVMLATRVGIPISTTHALIGALVGAGYVSAGQELNLSVLGTTFFIPLLLSPLISVILASAAYLAAHWLVPRLGINRESCICIGPRQFVPVGATAFAVGCCEPGMTSSFVMPNVSTGTAPDCVTKYSGHVLGVTAQGVADSLHYLSAAAVSFARGLNDTPKIAGLLLLFKAFDIRFGMLAIAAVMALGGWLNARRVAETMAKKITRMNDGQALTANLVTAMLVIGASRFGMPVSTTHVSVGAISGIGLINGTANRSVITSIMMSWLLTLPIAALTAGLASLVLKQYN